MAADDEGVAYMAENIGLEAPPATESSAASMFLNIGVGAPNAYFVVPKRGWGVPLREEFTERVDLSGQDSVANMLNIT